MKTILTESDFNDRESFRKSEANQILSCYKVIEKAENEEEKDDFKHNRMMAGYHSMKADELTDEALTLHTGNHEGVQDEIKNKKGEIEKHRTAAEEHRNIAKKLYSKDQHGEWGATVPTKAEVLEYGNKEAKKNQKAKDKVVSDDTDYVNKAEKVDAPELQDAIINKMASWNRNKNNDKDFEHNLDQTIKQLTESRKEGQLGITSVSDKLIQAVRAKYDEVNKAESDTLFKAEGSRGGKVIGHTKSGKPIYEAFHDSYKNFSSEDHRDAAKAHAKAKHEAHGASENESGNPKHLKDVAKHKLGMKHHMNLAELKESGSVKGESHYDEKGIERNNKNLSSISSKEMKDTVEGKFKGDHKAAAQYYNLNDADDLKGRISAKEKLEGGSKKEIKKSDAFGILGVK